MYLSIDQAGCVPCEDGTVSTESGATSCASCGLGKEANSDKIQCGKCSCLLLTIHSIVVND